jgi:hypothetical protein
MINGRRQPSSDGTSRMTRECQVRICEGLEVQFLGPMTTATQFESGTGVSESRYVIVVDAKPSDIVTF